MAKLKSLCISVPLLVLAIGLQTPNVESANILGIFLSHSPSHLIVHMSVIKALAERGHNVTVVTTLKPIVTHDNIKNIIISPTPEHEKLLSAFFTEISSMENSLWTILTVTLTSMTKMMDVQYAALEDERFTALYKQDTKFDVVVMGYFFNDFALGAAAKFNAPIIIDWPANIFDIINVFVGNPFEWSYVPNMSMGMKPGQIMSFGQRVQNFVGGILYRGVGYILKLRWQKNYDDLFPDTNFPSFEDMRKNVSLVFCNTHFSEGLVRPNVPALIEIGGVQIKENPDPLPKNIAEHLNAAKKHGAILFCLGSNIKSSHVKSETWSLIFKVLSSLKQNVIWKWDDLANVPGHSANILYSKWLPQDDILAHSNLKLFITHAGKGGIAESQYHAVPMLALPIFADQTGNAEIMASSGYGLKLNLRTLSESDFGNSINEILTNRTYADNVQKFSQLYRDRPMTSKQLVVYWTEYVIRHHGAPHMQSPLVHMNAIQAVNLDVIAFLTTAILIVFSILGLVVKFIYIKCCKSKKGRRKAKQH